MQQDADAAPRLTLSEIDAFRAQMQRCWSPPSGARDAEDLRILVRLSLTPTGAISAGPVVVNRARWAIRFSAPQQRVCRAPFAGASHLQCRWKTLMPVGAILN